MKVDLHGPSVRPELGNCWTWKGHVATSGYGQFNINGRDMKASRAAWILYNGPLKREDFICHDCDNPSCVRMDHLYKGDSKTNQQDVAKRKRRKHEACPVAKLTWDVVRQIRAIDARMHLNNTRKRQTIADRFCLSEITIRRIIGNKYWLVEDDPGKAN